VISLCIIIGSLLGATTEPATRPEEIRRGMSMNEPPETRYQRYYERLARQIEPELRGDPSKLDIYLKFFEREIIHDKRVIAFDLKAEALNGVIVLSGVTEFAEHTGSLTEFFKAIGFERVENSVKLAPTIENPFAVVKAKRSFIYSAPDAPHEVLNETTAGETIYLLAVSSDGDHFLCHAPDGYVGWIAAADVEQLNRARFDALQPSAPRDPARIEAVIASAKSKMGLPYVWGGRSDEGVDCSGLVQTAFASQGINLPRDAEQQASVGKLVATRWHRDNLRRGDLLYFLGRRGIIAHTGIYLGNNEFIEAADGGVKVSSFDAKAENYAGHRDETFCFAKRVLE
jgi:cell wall-associated NlpC family hydrolase